MRWGAGAVLLAAAAHVGTHGMAVFWFPLAAVAAAGGVWWWQHRKAAHGDHLLLWALAGAWVLMAAHAGPLAFDGVLQGVGPVETVELIRSAGNTELTTTNALLSFTKGAVAGIGS